MRALALWLSLAVAEDAFLRSRHLSVSDEVARDRAADVKFRDVFAAPRVQLLQRNAPDVSDEVSRERGEDIQIHDGFGALESKDHEDEKRIKKNRDLQALMQLRQRNAPDVSDEVARERGENTQTHDGFGAMESKAQEEV